MLSKFCSSFCRYDIEESQHRSGLVGIMDQLVESKLVIHDIEYRDLTKYKCHAENAAGFDFEEMTLRYDGKGFVVC